MVKNYLKEIAKILEIRFPTRQFSKDLGYSESVVSVYLNDKNKVSPNFIKKLNEVYDINYKKLVKELELINNPVQVQESEVSYQNTTEYEKTKILIKLKEVKKQAEDYLYQLENTPKTAHIFEEYLKTIEVLKKIEKNIEKIKNS